MRRPPPLLCLSWIAFVAGAAGCIEGSLEQKPAASSPGRAQVAPSRCAPTYVDKDPGAPSVDDFRPALGERAGSPIVQSLDARLGDKYSGVLGPYFVQDYLLRGVRLHYRDTLHGRWLRRAEFFGRDNNFTSFGGELPLGLRFSMEQAEVERVLGPPDEGSCVERRDCWYRERGLVVRFADGCLGSVGIVLPVAPRTTRFSSLTIVASGSHVSRKGIHVQLEQDSGSQPGLDRAEVEIRLLSEKGDPIKSREKDAPFADEAGSIRLRATGAQPNVDARIEVFVPYSGLALPPGQHTLRGRITARAWPPKDNSTGAISNPVDLEVLGGGDFAFPLRMPLVKQVRVSVARVDVTPGRYDNADALFSRPDLFWSFGIIQGGRYKSPTREDTLKAAWTDYSTWMTMAEGDSWVICVQDEDVLGEDDVGCLPFTLSDALQWSKDKKPRVMSVRRVDRLEMRPPQIRD